MKKIVLSQTNMITTFLSDDHMDCTRANLKVISHPQMRADLKLSLNADLSDLRLYAEEPVAQLPNGLYIRMADAVMMPEFRSLLR